MNYKPVKFDIPKNSYNKVAVAVDMSASITKNQRTVIRKTLQQLIELLAKSGKFSLTIWTFDCFVDHRSIKTFESYDKQTFDADVQHTLSYGRGGSNLDVNFSLIEALGLSPDVLFVITDGCVSVSKNINYGHYKKHVILFDNSYIPNKDHFCFEYDLHCLELDLLSYQKNA